MQLIKLQTIVKFVTLLEEWNSMIEPCQESKIKMHYQCLLFLQSSWETFYQNRIRVAVSMVNGCGSGHQVGAVLLPSFAIIW